MVVLMLAPRASAKPFPPRARVRVRPCEMLASYITIPAPRVLPRLRRRVRVRATDPDAANAAAKVVADSHVYKGTLVNGFTLHSPMVSMAMLR